MALLTHHDRGAALRCRVPQDRLKPTDRNGHKVLVADVPDVNAEDVL